MQKVQEVSADAVIVGLHVDDAAIVAVVIPVKQSRTEAGHQPISDVASTGGVVVLLLRQNASEHRGGGAHHIHGVA